MTRRGGRRRRLVFAATATILILCVWQAVAVAGTPHPHTGIAGPHAPASDGGGGSIHDHGQHPAAALGDPPCVDAAPDCGAEHACGHCVPAAACALTDACGTHPAGNAAVPDHTRATGPPSPPFRPPART